MSAKNEPTDRSDGKLQTDIGHQIVLKRFAIQELPTLTKDKRLVGTQYSKLKPYK